MSPLLFNIVLLQQDLVKKTLEIDPYGTAAIGVLLAALLFAVGFLWRSRESDKKIYQAELTKEREYNREVSNKIIALVTKVGAGFDADQAFKTELENKISNLLREFELLDQWLRSSGNGNSNPERK